MDGPQTVTVLVPGADERAMSPHSDGPEKFLMFLPLVTHGADGSLEGCLARSWEPSDDYSEWTIHLNTAAHWHDGLPVTSEDIAYSMSLMASDVVGYGQYNNVEIELIDDSTFVWKSRHNTPLDDYLSFFPKHVLENLDPERFWEWDFWKRPIGSGPYRYVRHVEKTMTELEAVPDYFRGRPSIDRVILRYGSGESVLAELLAGNVDAMELDPMDVPKVEDDPRYQITYKIEFWRNGAGYGIMWNHHHPILRDPRIRRAATLAIDRRAVHAILHMPDDLPVFDVLFTERQLDELPEPIPYDPDSARQLLQELGWRDADNDGIRERDGEQLAFTAITSPGEGDRIAIVVQDYLREVGIRLEIRTLPREVILRMRAESGDFDAVILRANPGAWAMFGPESVLGYSNKQVHRLLEAAQATLNPAVTDSLYRESWSHFQTDVPVTFLFPRISLYVSDRHLHGLNSPYHGNPVWYMEDLWWEQVQ